MGERHMAPPDAERPAIGTTRRLSLSAPGASRVPARSDAARPLGQRVSDGYVGGLDPPDFRWRGSYMNLRIGAGLSVDDV